MCSDPRMQAAPFGNTGIEVSRLCVGTLTASRWHRGLSPQQAAKVYRAAVAAGVNFFDTAKIYGTYAHLAALLQTVPRHEVVLASKSYAVTGDEARRDVEDALLQLGTTYIDIFLLHEQESAHTLRGHREALLELHRLRERGVIRAAGLSTHCVEGVLAACAEPLIEVICPLLNIDGTGIVGGDREAMLSAIAAAHECGKAVYAMKPLAGGHLAGRAEEALAFVRDIPYIHAVAVGIGGEAELAFALSVLAGSAIPQSVRSAVAGAVRRLVVEPWCDGCGQCVEACGHDALRLESGVLRVDEQRCVLCGYCAARCPHFHLKVV
ncbi:MAG: aldo/keto reductase [Bacillota bacterium]|nr:aldo/keto reductase [Bacillota bacterium]